MACSTSRFLSLGFRTPDMSIINLIVGSSTSALLHCLFSNSTLVINSIRRPPVYSKVKDRPEAELWEELYWVLFLQNKILTHNVKSINLFRDKIEVIHENNIQSIWDFETLCIDDCERVTGYGLDILLSNNITEVRDYFAVKRGMAHEEELIETSDSFVKKVFFFVSPRIDGNKKKKDAVAISYIEKENLINFDYSDTMVRFKLEKLMNSKLNLSRKVKIQHLRREVLPSFSFEVVNAGPRVKKLLHRNFNELYARYKSEYTR